MSNRLSCYHTPGFFVLSKAALLAPILPVESDTTDKVGGLMSGVASKAIALMK